MIADTPDRMAWRPPELAKRLGVSRTTVYAWIEKGLIPTVRVGSTVMIPAGPFEEWWARQIKPGRP